MNGDERRADLLCAGVLSPYPVILRAPQPAVYHPCFGNGKIEVWELVGGTASSGRPGIMPRLPSIRVDSGSTDITASPSL